MPINWEKTQKNLGALVDGKPGRETYGRLIMQALGRSYVAAKPDPIIEKVANGFAKQAPRYGADQSPARLADAIAQMAHETGHFRQWEENLNYSAGRMAEIWPGRFAVNPKAKPKQPNALAKSLAYRPEALANLTYGLRMGNVAGVNDNDEHPDGWQYRGRGPGLTGKVNYRNVGLQIGLPLEEFPDLASDPATAVLIYLQFCRNAGTFGYIDAGDIEGARRSYNGGLIGLDAVNTIRARILEVLK